MSRLGEPGLARSGSQPSVRSRIACLLSGLALVLTTSFGGAVLAQETENEEGEPQVFDFEGDEISTDYLKPTTMMVEGLRRGRMSSLISVRLHFVDEIVKSAEDI